jgi:hypothetical protein
VEPAGLEGWGAEVLGEGLEEDVSGAVASALGAGRVADGGDEEGVGSAPRHGGGRGYECGCGGWCGGWLEMDGLEGEI